MELDRLLEDRGATRGLVLCSETVLRHNAVTEGRDLEMGKKKKKKNPLFNATIDANCFE